MGGRVAGERERGGGCEAGGGREGGGGGRGKGEGGAGAERACCLGKGSAMYLSVMSGMQTICYKEADDCACLRFLIDCVGVLEYAR